MNVSGSNFDAMNANVGGVSILFVEENCCNIISSVSYATSICSLESVRTENFHQSFSSKCDM